MHVSDGIGGQGSPSWNAIFDALLVAHIGGDFLLQTEWQALCKGKGIADREGRRALALHVGTYSLAFLPALKWINRGRGAGRALALGAGIALPHMLIDDGTLVHMWLRRVKHVEQPDRMLRLMVDQSAHVLCLLATAMVVAD